VPGTPDYGDSGISYLSTDSPGTNTAMTLMTGIVEMPDEFNGAAR
jgi:hypothetical protein